MYFVLRLGQFPLKKKEAKPTKVAKHTSTYTLEKLQQHPTSHSLSHSTPHLLNQTPALKKQLPPSWILTHTKDLANKIKLLDQSITIPPRSTLLEHIPNPAKQLRCTLASLAPEKHLSLTQTGLDLTRADLVNTDGTVGVGPV
jgi:hypothetical protein